MNKGRERERDREYGGRKSRLIEKESVYLRKVKQRERGGETEK